VLDRGDELRAADLARQVLRRYPATPPAATAVTLLERIAAAHGGGLALEDLLQAAAAARLRGDRAEVVRRLETVHALLRGKARAQVGVDLARALREARRFDAGLGVVLRDLKAADQPALRAQLRLERARLLRDSNRGPEALRAYAALEGRGTPADIGAAAAWERGIELLDAGRYSDARGAFSAVAASGGERAADARLLAGLAWVAAGRPARADAEWRSAEGEAFEFWRAVLERRAARDSSARDRADRVLASIATRPGYGFYRVAARDTLGVRGWPGVALAGDTCRPRPAALELAAALLALGDAGGSMLVLQRWSASGTGTGVGSDTASGCETGTLIEAAELAAAAGRMPVAIRLAQKAMDASPRADSSVAWGLVARMYPPALDTLYSRIPERLGDAPLDRSLLRAVAWQESRFDPQARSRGDALGLYQLKLATAGDMARRLGDPAPDREALLQPATSLRYGREYLAWLIERFDGEWIVALSAYNSGPSAVPEGWRSLLERGGPALFCELIGRPETRDYVRRILGARQAYRELRGYAATPPTASVR
jgi:soluble lytic murein transglycosylase